MKKILLLSISLLITSSVHAITLKTLVGKVKEYGDPGVPRFELVNKGPSDITYKLEIAHGLNKPAVMHGEVKKSKFTHRSAVQPRLGEFDRFILEITETNKPNVRNNFEFEAYDPKETFYFTWDKDGLRPQKGQIKGSQIKKTKEGKDTAVTELGYALLNNVSQKEINEAHPAWKENPAYQPKK